jgi:hypothetical protein
MKSNKEKWKNSIREGADWKNRLEKLSKKKKKRLMSNLKEDRLWKDR